MRNAREFVKNRQGSAARGRRAAATARGFSAVEVLIAAAVMVIAILGIASMFPTAYTNVNKSGKQTLAVSLAQQQIEVLRNQTYAAVATGNDSVTVSNSIYTRAWTVTNDTPIAGVKQVVVTVTPPAGAGQPVTVTSLVAR